MIPSSRLTAMRFARIAPVFVLAMPVHAHPGQIRPHCALVLPVTDEVHASQGLRVGQPRAHGVTSAQLDALRAILQHAVKE
jgi:hypothetical protein